MENILAVDASTKRTGLATIINGQIKYSVIASSSASVEKRIGIMRDGIIQFIKDNNIDKVILEEVHTEVANNHIQKMLTWLQGCIVVAIFEYNKNIKVEFIGASSWRSVLGLQGYRVKREQQKQKDIDYVNSTYGLSLTTSQDDEADAICILTAYLKNSDKMILKEVVNTKPQSILEYESAF
jgi:Holliday junction resolvasome RuvABC endonuclease subunit